MNFPKQRCFPALRYLPLLLSFLSYSIPAFAGDPPMADFSAWKVVYLRGGTLACTPDANVMHEEFNGGFSWPGWSTFTPCGQTTLNDDCCGARSAAYMDDHFYMDENVQFDTEGHLVLIADLGLYTPDPNDIDPEDPIQLFPDGETRPYSSGMVIGGGNVVLDQFELPIEHGNDFFFYGTYLIKCGMPVDKNGQVAHMWNSFWMWHHDEIDIMEYFGYNGYYTNSHSGHPNLNGSPLGGYSQGQDNPMTINPGGTPGPDLIYGVEFTPFYMTFFRRATESGPNLSEFTIYKYYDLEGTPLTDVECGSQIPAGYYKINPAYTRTSDQYGIRSFQPMITLATLPDAFEDNDGTDCNCPANVDCNANPGPGWWQDINYAALMPITWKIDWVKISETKYELLSLKPDLCGTMICSADELCFTLESEVLNVSHNADLITPSTFTVAPADWQYNMVPTTIQSTATFSSNPEKICIDPTAIPAKLSVFATVNGPGGPYTVNTNLTGDPNNNLSWAPPSVFYVMKTCNPELSEVYIATNGRCKDDITFTVTSNGQPVSHSAPVWESDELLFFTVDALTFDVTVTYPDGCASSGQFTESFSPSGTVAPTCVLNQFFTDDGKCITEITIYRNGNRIKSISIPGVHTEVQENKVDFVKLYVHSFDFTVTIEYLCGTVTTNFSRPAETPPSVSTQFINCNNTEVCIARNGRPITEVSFGALSYVLLSETELMLCYRVFGAVGTVTVDYTEYGCRPKTITQNFSPPTPSGTYTYGTNGPLPLYSVNSVATNTPITVTLANTITSYSITSGIGTIQVINSQTLSVSVPRGKHITFQVNFLVCGLQLTRTITFINNINLLLFPNPASDDLTIMVASAPGEDGQAAADRAMGTPPVTIGEFEVVDLSGRVVLREASSGEGLAQYTVSVKALPPGYYIARIFDPARNLLLSEGFIKK